VIRAGTGPVARRTWSRGRRGQSWQTYVRQMRGQGSFGSARRSLASAQLESRHGLVRDVGADLTGLTALTAGGLPPAISPSRIAVVSEGWG